MASNKKVKGMMEEISDNLKNTMMKYNEMELDRELSVVNSIDGEEGRLSNLIVSKESVSKDYLSSYEKSESLTPMKLNRSKQETMSNRGGKELEGDKKDDSRCQMNFEQKALRLVCGLNDLEKQINKDFEAVEDMIEKSINNELMNIIM